MGEKVVREMSLITSIILKKLNDIGEQSSLYINESIMQKIEKNRSRKKNNLSVIKITIGKKKKNFYCTSLCSCNRDRRRRNKIFLQNKECYNIVMDDCNAKTGKSENENDVLRKCGLDTKN